MSDNTIREQAIDRIGFFIRAHGAWASTTDADEVPLAIAEAMYDANLLAGTANTTDAEDWRRQVLDTFGYDDTPENAAEVLTYQPAWKAEQAAEVAELRAALADLEALRDRVRAQPMSRRLHDLLLGDQS